MTPQNPIKVYVACPFLIREEAAAFARQCEAIPGVKIIHQWWTVESDAAWVPSDPQGPDPVVHKKCAVDDVNAVCEADVVVALVPLDGGTGMWVEVGVALAHEGKPVWLVGLTAVTPPWRSIFDLLCKRMAQSDALARLAQWSEDRARGEAGETP